MLLPWTPNSTKIVQNISVDLYGVKFDDMAIITSMLSFWFSREIQVSALFVKIVY